MTACGVVSALAFVLVLVGLVCSIVWMFREDARRTEEHAKRCAETMLEIGAKLNELSRYRGGK